MTQAEAAAGLLAGATNGTSQFVNVLRDQLVLALGGAQPEVKDDDAGAETDAPAVS